jgi:DNA-directed RNA polymerase subunit beta
VKKVKYGRRERIDFSRIPGIMEMPDLIDFQRKSYEAFLQKGFPVDNRQDVGLQSVFSSVFPIWDFNEVSSLEFVSYSLLEPKYNVRECQERGMTYSVPMKVTLRLVIREEDPETGTKKVKDIREQEVFFCDLPMMTDRGTFMINGAERVIVSQLHRSPGVTFDEDDGKLSSSGKKMYMTSVIPYHGSWLEFEFDVNGILFARIDRKRKFVASTLIRAWGLHKAWGLNGKEGFSGEYEDISDEDILKIFFEVEDCDVSEKKLAGKAAAQDVANPETGEVVVEAGADFAPEVIAVLKKLNVKSVKAVPSNPGVVSILNTIRKDNTHSTDTAVVEIYKKMRPGDPPTLENAKNLMGNLFFSKRRYDLARVGRYKMNKKLGLKTPIENRTISKENLVSIIRYLFDLCNGKGEKDDIDHLGNRRVRTAGELLENKLRLGFTRMERAVRERMSIVDMDMNPMPSQLISTKPITAAVKEFFGTSQLSQFMDQTNPLAELTHKRRLSALGPGGLNRERAGFEVRDVHHTHYGRVCPIETPEGPNIGLIASLSTYAQINEYGFVTTPLRRVEGGKVSKKIEFLPADDADKFIIAQANTPLDENNKFTGDIIAARSKDDFPLVTANDIHYMDVSPRQLFSVATSLIPFLEHDDANRALMGSNMQRQAVPLIRTEAPFVGTGMEYKAAYDSGVLVIAKRDGIVAGVSSDEIIVFADDEDPSGSVDIYKLTKYKRSNQDTCINQRPIVKKGEKVKRGDVIADGPSTDQGELALGRNLLVAFMPWRGFNFEDAIIVSEKLVREDYFTSVHVEEFELEARDTKLGKEEITRDIPNVGDEALKDLDEEGIVRIGAEVVPGDILVGKVTPKGETELTPEEKLLRAIFGEKAGDVRDASLRVPPGVEGKVIDVKVFKRKEKDEKIKGRDASLVKAIEKDSTHQVRQLEKENENRIESLKKQLEEKSQGLNKPEKAGLEEKFDEEIKRLKEVLDSRVRDIDREKNNEIDKVKKGDELPPGVIKLVKVYIAKKRKLSVGDKMAGRHGNKGVVSKIVPVEDMPYLPNGRPVDIILNPLGVPSRMNVGQILETHLGWAAAEGGYHVSSPVFDGAREDEIRKALKEQSLPETGKITLFDGMSGEAFDQEVTVGYIYILKLAHLVDDKIHARSIGPYSLITQQPLGGKAQFGGQRFGEMEVWALEAYGAAYTLQELLTVKSDDVQGRTKIYESIVKGKNSPEPGVPESFNVLVKELQGLCLDVKLLKSSN